MLPDEYKFIEGQIGYKYYDLDLLDQAFNLNDNGDNKLLIFIGSKVFNTYSIKYMNDKYLYYVSDYNRLEQNALLCNKSIKEVSDDILELLSNRSIANALNKLGISKYYKSSDSSLANLFKAIIGSILLDSNYNYEIVYEVMNIILINNIKDDYGNLLYEWCIRNKYLVPTYSYYLNECKLWLRGNKYIPYFKVNGCNKLDARNKVCKKAYEYLINNNLLCNIKNEVGNVTIENAINLLETLARRGYFELPIYNYLHSYDDNGNSIWTCECFIHEYDKTYSCISNNKREAKRLCAYKMLMFIMDNS